MLLRKWPFMLFPHELNLANGGTFDLAPLDEPSAVAKYVERKCEGESEADRAVLLVFSRSGGELVYGIRGVGEVNGIDRHGRWGYLHRLHRAG